MQSPLEVGDNCPLVAIPRNPLAHPENRCRGSLTFCSSAFGSLNQEDNSTIVSPAGCLRTWFNLQDSTSGLLWPIIVPAIHTAWYESGAETVNPGSFL